MTEIFEIVPLTHAHKAWIERELNLDTPARLHLNLRGFTGVDKVVKEDQWNFNWAMVSDQTKEPIAFITGHYSAESSQGYISEVYVSEPHRKKGFAGHLIKTFEDRVATEYPATQFYTFTIENKPMEKVLLKMGYIKRGIYKGFIRRGKKNYDQTLWQKRVEKV